MDPAESKSEVISPTVTQTPPEHVPHDPQNPPPDDRPGEPVNSADAAGDALTRADDDRPRAAEGSGPATMPISEKDREEIKNIQETGSATREPQSITAGDLGTLPPDLVGNEPEPAAVAEEGGDVLGLDFATLRERRVRLLRLMVADCTIGVTQTPESLRSVIEGRLQVDLPELNLILTRLEALRATPVPADTLDGWQRLATNVHALWRQYFAVATPIDQQQNELLHNLGNSIAAPAILGSLALRAHVANYGELNAKSLETIIDGSQTKELSAAGVDPGAVLDLVNAVSHANSLLVAVASIARPAAPAS